VLGLPGAGKTTLAASLAKRVGAAHLMASAVLRDYAGRNAEVAGILRDSWSRGENAPDEIVEPVLWNAYSTSLAKLVILDGYPRTPNQWKSFLSRGGGLVMALSLNVSPEIALARTTARVGRRAIDALPARLEHGILAEVETVRSLVSAIPADRCLHLDADTLSAAEVLKIAADRTEKALGGGW